MIKNIKRNIIWYLIMSSIALTLIIWIASKWYYDDWFTNPYKYVAKLASLSSTIIFTWSFILSTKLKLLDKLANGLDKLYHIHSKLGRLGSMLILLHPLFLAFNRLPNLTSFFNFFLFLPFKLPLNLQSFLDLFKGNYALGHNLGIIIFIFLHVLVFLTVFLKKLKLPYHIWHYSHKLFPLFYLGIIAHVFFVTADITAYPVLTSWMSFWFILGIASILWTNFFYSFIGPKFKYQVSEIEIIDNIIEVWLAPGKNLNNLINIPKVMNFQPSQFIYLQIIDNKNIDTEIHPFSIACDNTHDGKIKLGIKMSGDYTKTLAHLKVGNAVNIYGPYGQFAKPFFAQSLGQRDCVMIGGGIGITPFIGLWERALKRDSNKDDEVDLFYVCNTKKEASFINDLEEIELKYKDKKSRNNVLNLFINEETGTFITADYIREKCISSQNFTEKLFLLCGPLSMMQALTKQLTDLGVSKEFIISENFDFFG
jgi:predicted ferric reductase